MVKHFSNPIRKLLPLLLLVGVFLALGVALASPEKSGEIRLLGADQVWKVEFPPGEYAYSIEYLEGDMFITVAASFLDQDAEVLHTSTHTLIQNERMAAHQTFSSDKVADKALATAIQFKCDSGKVRIRFGEAAKLEL